MQTTQPSAETAGSPPINEFEQFHFSDSIAKGIAAMGFTSVRPIQTQTIPAVLNGRDVLGMAETGTGKTAAFALPIIQRLIQTTGTGIRALIIAPTRELAMQIDAEIQQLAKYTPLKTTTVYGGVSAENQTNRLRNGADIVVACPGRLLDLLQQKALHFNHVELFVLDEADHLFDMGFLPDIKRILNALPEKRQNLMFSATMPSEIRKLAEQVLNNPMVAELARTKPASTIAHSLYPVAHKRKFELLEHLFSADSISSAIIFTRTKYRARQLAKRLTYAGRKAVSLQGNMSQNQRDNAMSGFRKGQFDILVATDIAARGIDVAHVSHVVNFDIPDTPEAYTARIGRTGRAEQTGQAYTFITIEDQETVRTIERKLGSAIPRQIVEGIGGLESHPSTAPVKQAKAHPSRINNNQQSYAHRRKTTSDHYARNNNRKIPSYTNSRRRLETPIDEEINGNRIMPTKTISDSEINGNCIQPPQPLHIQEGFGNRLDGNAQPLKNSISGHFVKANGNCCATQLQVNTSHGRNDYKGGNRNPNRKTSNRSNDNRGGAGNANHRNRASNKRG